MNQKFSYIQSFKIIVLALLIAVGTSYLFADWTEPTTTPPGCPAGNPGCDAPINTSRTRQSKLGQLSINTNTVNPIDVIGLQVFGKSIFKKGTDPIAVDVNGTIKTTGLQVTGGTTGQVLASDATGNATWKTLDAVIPGTYTSSQAWVEIDTGPNYLNSGSYTLHLLAGNIAAFKIITSASAATGSIWNSVKYNGKLSGLACNDGWTISGCWSTLIDGADTDLIPYENGCVTNDFRDAGRRYNMTISCVASY